MDNFYNMLTILLKWIDNKYQIENYSINYFILDETSILVILKEIFS